MTQEHPITPSSELVEKWYEAIDNSSTSWKQELTTQAARWGADQELEACCQWQDTFNYQNAGNLLRAARRPKPPSLKELALAKLEAMERLWEASGNTPSDIIRRALESLPD